jgi:Nif-specific regulatory protein
LNPHSVPTQRLGLSQEINMDNISKSDEVQLEEQALDKKQALKYAQDLALLYDISTTIHTIRNRDDLLLHIYDKVKEVIKAEGASIALHDSECKEFLFFRTAEHGTDASSGGLTKIRLPDHLGVAGWVLKENKTAVIQNVYRDRRFSKKIDSPANLENRSIICVPLRTRKGIVGVLYAHNKLTGEFTEREARLLRTLSDSIAISIENATRYGELTQHAQMLESENRRLKSETVERFNLQGVIGTSPAMQRLFSLVEKVMDTTTTVLLTGETGTGKELIAKIIHYNSVLKNKPFVAENCAALAEDLLESELFGHVKGAFTGAVADKKGLFELASGGTILLDEIGETSTTMQVKLLRVLQEGQIRPVGGQNMLNVNVRLITSTHRDLEEEVRKGAFREDLFYRINVFPIKLPSLKERPEDIPLLADFFLKRFAKKHQRPLSRFTSEAMDLLSQYKWPGNVRQLENEIERALIIAGDNEAIQANHLSTKLNAWVEKAGISPQRDCTLKETIERVEQQMIRAALKDAKGKKAVAASRLGLSRQGMLNKIKRYGLIV